MLDVISPCTTFNDHEGSTKSYSFVKDHDEPLQDVSFVPFFEDIAVDYDPRNHRRRDHARRLAPAAAQARPRLRRY